MSSTKPEGQELCYECALFYDPEEVQEWVCTICEGRKCKDRHGGDFHGKCDQCARENICVDCQAFGRCCGLK